MKFLHTADWQIGRQYERFGPEDGPALAEARTTTIERIARLAVDENVDAVLVAGDVFDSQTVSDRTIRRLFLATQAFAGPWIMIPGNHDAALAESVWTRAARLNAIPANIHVALLPEIMLFEEQGFAVLPAPLTQRHTYGDLTEWFDTAETPDGLLRIGLAHGSVQGVLADDVDSPNPIAENRATRARLDYLALGDWHGARQINGRTWYCGTPEQDRFKDNGAGHVLVVQLSECGAVPLVEQRPIGQYPWIQWEETLHVAGDLDQLIHKLEQVPQDSVLNIILEGQIDLEGEQRLRTALSEADARHRSVLCDLIGLRLEPTEADIAALRVDGYLGEVIATLRDQQTDNDADTAREALAILARLLRDRQPQEQNA